MTTSRKIKLTELIAPAFYPVHRDIAAGGHTYYRLSGGRGSTKSSFVGVEIILGMMRDALAGQVTNCVVFRRYRDNLRDSVFEQLLWAIQALGVSQLWRETVSPLKLVYLPTGQTVLFRGADKAEKAKSIKLAKGYIKYLWFEELSEFEGADKLRSIQQSIVRGGEEFRVFYSYNPPRSVRSWVNDPQQWRREDLLTHHSDYRTVPPAWLGEQFLSDAEFLQSANPAAYEHEYLGLVTGTGSEVFTNVRAQTITDDDIAAFDRVYNGLDWGYYPDPWAFNRMHYDAARRTLFIFDELTMYRAGNRQTADALLRRGITANDRITADSAEPKSIGDYKNYGLYCRGAIKGPDSVDYSMKWLQSLSRIIIDPARCPDTYREFTEYEYRQDREGLIEDGYPDANNHHIDAVRYAMEQVWRKRGL